MNYAEIKPCDIANGIGVRVSIFVSGCTHHCKGCFNEITWDFNYGKKFTVNTISNILELLSKSYISGLSILGGEPFEYKNQVSVNQLVQAVKSTFPKKDIWIYTGYSWEDNILKTSLSQSILHKIDVLVDGEFIESLKDISLKFCGSSNQRIIDVRKSIGSNKVMLYNI